MLCEAAGRLPEGYRLAIIEGWRPPYIQSRMYRTGWNMLKERHPDWSDVKIRRVVNQFTAPLDTRVPPPHTTGGAVDLNLVDAAGKPLDHSSPYPALDQKGFLFAAPGLTDTAQKHRDILAEALSGTGLTNYPSEYWHWSYGDQGWAYRGGHPRALYAQIEPEGWTPNDADVSNEVFTYLG